MAEREAATECAYCDDGSLTICDKCSCPLCGDCGADWDGETLCPECNDRSLGETR